jgi:hypothetical protein
MTDGMVANNENDSSIQEQMVPQSKVNEIVGREKRLAEQRAQRDLEAKHQQELEAMRNQGQNFDVNAIEERAAAKAEERMQAKFEEQQREHQKQQYVQYLDNVAGNYVEKMKAGPSLYDDFQQVTAEFEPKEFKDLLFAAHDMPELPDIIYELSQDGDRLNRLDNLASKSPKMAKRELQKLAESIKVNKQAKQNNPSINPPLKSIKPSTAAGVSDGKMNLKDLKKVSWLKG